MFVYISRGDARRDVKEPKSSMMPFNTKHRGQQVRMLTWESKLHVYAVSKGIDTGRVCVGLQG